MKINDKFISAPNSKCFNVIGNLNAVISSGGIFIDNKGYIDDDNTIWIFSGSGQPKYANMYPYFWYENNKSLVFSSPSNSILECFNKKNITDMSIDTIKARTKENEKLYDEQVINDINSASSVFIPEIKDTDDPCKKCIKYAIIQKNTDVNRHKNRATTTYLLANLKAALLKDTKMSMYYFNLWTEFLGLNSVFILYDNGTDTVDPLPKPIIYDSNTDSVRVPTKQEMLDLIEKLYGKGETS